MVDRIQLVLATLLLFVPAVVTAGHSLSASSRSPKGQQVQPHAPPPAAPVQPDDKLPIKRPESSTPITPKRHQLPRTDRAGMASVSPAGLDASRRGFLTVAGQRADSDFPVKSPLGQTDLESKQRERSLLAVWVEGPRGMPALAGKSTHIRRYATPSAHSRGLGSKSQRVNHLLGARSFRRCDTADGAGRPRPLCAHGNAVVHLVGAGRRMEHRAFPCCGRLSADPCRPGTLRRNRLQLLDRGRAHDVCPHVEHPGSISHEIRLRLRSSGTGCRRSTKWGDDGIGPTRPLRSETMPGHSWERWNGTWPVREG